MILYATYIDLIHSLFNRLMSLVATVRRVFTRSFWKRRIPLLVALGFLLVSSLCVVVQVWFVLKEKQRYLYYPENWIVHKDLRKNPQAADSIYEEQQTGSVGGGSLGLLPLDIKLYKVREGDTLSGIAERFGMDLDTIASLNREWGSGVHLIQIGEAIKIPNQNGIFIPIDGDLESVCREKDVPAEVVLAVNRIERQSVQPDMELFFPGVQHTGIERSVITGSAFLKPVAGYLTSGFGYRRDPFTQEMHFHRGVDLAAPTGTAVRAALDGKVVVVGNDPVLGKYILIRHQISYSSLYGHLSQIWVQRGSTVTRGQKIGAIGNTGRSTGPHLHFEIRRRGVPVNAWGLMTSRF